MAGKDIIMATQKELRALHLIHKAIDKVITQKEAAESLELSERQIRRKVKRILQEGGKGIIHRLRGISSNRAIPDKNRSKILTLLRTKYPDFGPALASEKLFERDKIEVNDETLRLRLIENNIPYKQRKKRPHHQWRERKERYGQMIQMDGSHHDWFEGRGAKCVLMGYIDDAAGIPSGRFYAYEGAIPAMDSFKRCIKSYGILSSVYLDKHSTYKSTKKPSIEDELNNTDPLSQFGRALKELKVEVIYADSPEAKGRIERLFRTFQDRLIKEMRLANICAIEEANEFLEDYLPIYAKRFAVAAYRSGDLHRTIPKGMDIDRILCIKTERALRRDFTAAHNKKLYQILDNVRVKKVMVEERVDGSIAIRHKDRELKYNEITNRPEKAEPQKTHEFRLRKIYAPLADHPWRTASYARYQQYQQREKAAPKEKGLPLTNI
ncbi:MAG: ISNCY family transposase [Candidatus Omnitrophota bacterium]